MISFETKTQNKHYKINLGNFIYTLYDIKEIEFDDLKIRFGTILIFYVNLIHCYFINKKINLNFQNEEMIHMTFQITNGLV